MDLHKVMCLKEVTPESRTFTLWAMISFAHPENEQGLSCESDACRSSAHNFASVSSAMLPAGSALIDTGAGHPTCGSLYFERIETELNTCGIPCDIIHAEQNVHSSMCKRRLRNRKYKISQTCSYETRKSNYFAEVLILDNDVPPLLPATLLDNCIVDLQRNVIVWNWVNKEPYETEMLRLKSKHRSIDISNFCEVGFCVPQRVFSKYGVLAFDFTYQAASPAAGI